MTLFKTVRNRTKAAAAGRKLADRFAPNLTSYAATAAGKNLAIIAGRTVRAAGVDVATGTPISVVNAGSPGMASYSANGAGLAVQYAGGSGTGSGGGMEVHDLTSAWHTGTLADAQAPQFLKTDGSRQITGNLTVAAGITVDGIDISAHAANPDAHHATATAGNGISITGQQISLAATVAGAGLTHSAGVIDVGAGTLIAVAPNTVGIATGAAYQFIGTGSDTGAEWRNVSELAGAGLVAATGILAVGAGNGITVNANDVALTTPGTLSVSSANNAAGNHTHAITSSSNPGQAAALLATNTNGAVTLRNAFLTQAAVSEATFVSGFAGSGWRADYGVTTAARASMETDDLTVRGRMRVYELLIQQIRATNGSVFVSSASKVVTVTASASPAWTINGSAYTINNVAATLCATLYAISTAAAGDTGRELYHGFLVGDVLRSQQVQWDGSTYDLVTQSDLEVVSVADLFNYTAVYVAGDAPAVGYDYVRLGSTTDSSRRGAVYLTADDSAAPFIDIIDGVQYHGDWNTPGRIKARLGKLSGISDADFGGSLGGYGLYGNNVYLKGQIVVTGGSLGGLAAADINDNTTTIDGGRITTNSITAAQIAAGTITTTEINFSPVLTGSVVASINATAEGIRIAGNRIQINGDVTFAANYDPTTKIGAGGAAADVNANTTTISGGKITTGSITATQISATAIDSMTITGATIRTAASGARVLLNSSGLTAYDSGSTAQVTLSSSSGKLTAGAGNVILSASGVAIIAKTSATSPDPQNRVDFLAYGGAASIGHIGVAQNVGYDYLSILQHSSGGGVANVQIEARSTSSWAANIQLKAHNTNAGVNKIFTFAHDSAAPTYNGYAMWHAGNDGAGSGMDADTVDGSHASAFATSGHNHDSAYAALSHNHDSTYGRLAVAGTWTATQTFASVDASGSIGGSWSTMTTQGTNSAVSGRTAQSRKFGDITFLRGAINPADDAGDLDLVLIATTAHRPARDQYLIAATDTGSWSRLKIRASDGMIIAETSTSGISWISFDSLYFFNT